MTKSLRFQRFIVDSMQFDDMECKHFSLYDVTDCHSCLVNRRTTHAWVENARVRAYSNQTGTRSTMFESRCGLCRTAHVSMSNTESQTVQGQLLDVLIDTEGRNTYFGVCSHSMVDLYMGVFGTLLVAFWVGFVSWYHKTRYMAQEYADTARIENTMLAPLLPKPKLGEGSPDEG